MFEAESNIVPHSISLKQIEINSTILSPIISRKDPTRTETIDENDEYNNSFKSIGRKCNVYNSMPSLTSYW